MREQGVHHLIAFCLGDRELPAANGSLIALSKLRHARDRSR
jgi:hypothetical protein